MKFEYDGKEIDILDTEDSPFLSDIFHIDDNYNNYKKFPNDAYWCYEIPPNKNGHIGDALRIAVKNVRYEPDDIDGYVYYYVTWDAIFYADDVGNYNKPLDEAVLDVYEMVIEECVKIDLEEC